MQAPDLRTDVLVIYYSRFGALELLAERIAEGARRADGVAAYVLEVDDRRIHELRPGETEDDLRQRQAALLNQLTAADALIVGAPAYFGSMASPLKRFFEDCATTSVPARGRSRPWQSTVFRGKVGAAFTASGTLHGGNEQTLHSILTMMMHFGMVLVTPGQQAPILEHQSSPYGATAVSGPDGSRPPSQDEQDAARELGEQVAEVAARLRWGRQARERAQREGRSERAATARDTPPDPPET
jgi:NAD(P)H dehydrogenase (quinone)